MADMQSTGSTRIYVGNLPRDVEKTEVEDAFARCGAIVTVFVARNPPGFAFVVRIVTCCCQAAFVHAETGLEHFRDNFRSSFARFLPIADIPGRIQCC